MAFRIHVKRVNALHLYLFLGAPVERIALDSKPRHAGWFQRAFVFKLKGLCITRVKGPTQLELVAGGWVLIRPSRFSRRRDFAQKYAHYRPKGCHRVRVEGKRR